LSNWEWGRRTVLKREEERDERRKKSGAISSF